MSFFESHGLSYCFLTCRRYTGDSGGLVKEQVQEQVQEQGKVQFKFRETKGYVQGVIRNAAQYRRLYDENGNFKPNVGARPLRGEIDSKPREQFTAEFPEIVVEDRTAE